MAGREGRACGSDGECQARQGGGAALTGNNEAEQVNTQADELGRAVMRACWSMGFALAGVAPARPSEWRREYLEWLAEGRHGDMGYLAEMLDERLDVTRLLPGARAVIVVADQYAERGAVDKEPSAESEPTGVIARYARGRDYHAVIKKRLHALVDRLRELHPEARFKSFADVTPVLEREQAVRARLRSGEEDEGTGVFIGKNTMVIHRRLGSYLLLGGIATTLELGGSAIEGQGTALDQGRCGTCTLCIDACPTGAIAPFRVDATRCVSYLTLEHAGVVDESLHTGSGDRLVGCDVCQDVCPFNRDAPELGPVGVRVNAAYADNAGLRARLPLLRVLGWSEQDRLRVLGASSAKRASLLMLRRSALIAAGNALTVKDDPTLHARIERIAADGREDEVLRETARQVLGRLGSRLSGGK